ncbi:O-fucosyltransferase 27-like isoform X1 [Cucurbita maxima]|uniref:O-fucosyltransferase family protein n=1 Tax=Cucurbita maxima TaxID=3661 RepID=A0A6J1IZK8_CUCMA|nr:O-fucosyltransferase 27-like isoform X1 [Cucurbita maxima]
MKGKGEMVSKSRMKWVGLLGIVLSTFSLFTHFFLAGFTQDAISEYQSSAAAVTIFSWRPVFEHPDFSPASPLFRRLWGPVRRLETLHPYANPRQHYPADPSSQSNGFIFVRIQGGFHEIRNSICDVVVIARLLNATLVIPEIQSTTSSKGISSQFKSFSYLYNEDHFIAALTRDVNIVKTLPRNLKGARRKKEIPHFKPSYLASPYFYRHHVLPVLKKHSVVELVISDGGCLQAVLPPDLEEYQRLRCRVAFHALQFRVEVQDLATKILHRLRAPGRPFVAYYPGMTREALAYYGCAELFQDVHNELIQHKRVWMRRRGIVKEKLSMNSEGQRLNGSCPLMPEEVGILLRAHGYSWDTIIYVSGGEVFGGQRTLIPLHAIFENVVDRTSLSTPWELSRLYGREINVGGNYPRSPPSVLKESKPDMWKSDGPRPRLLPPPPARLKYPHNIEGWWGWVAESDIEPESTVMELRTNAHKLLWEAIDYFISVEADVFIPGFDRDGKGHPNFASLVMGHRLYQSASLKTYRPDRREVATLLSETREQLYHANYTWLRSIRQHLRKSLLDGLIEASTVVKSISFLSHPVPECSCSRQDSEHAPSSRLTHSQAQAGGVGVVHHCPDWMRSESGLRSKDKQTEEDGDEDEPTSESFLGYRSGNRVERNGEMMSKEAILLNDQEELDGGER